MRFCGGFFKRRGRARSWILEGLRKLLTDRARSSSGTLGGVSSALDYEEIWRFLQLEVLEALYRVQWVVRVLLEVGELHIDVEFGFIKL